MKHIIFKKPGVFSNSLIAAVLFVLVTPFMCNGDEYPLTVNFRPEIINIASNRIGEIRVLTNTGYSNFIANGDSMLVFFNGSEDSVPNIQATTDSAGRLILTFTLDDLLVVEDDLIPDDYNTADVVLIMDNGDEYISLDNVIYIVDKIAP